MTPRDLIAAFDSVAEAPDGVERLRDLVLQLAVRGKLVPQNSSDEPASVLVQRIAVEKARMLRDGQIREPTRLSSESPSKVRFDVPVSWEWVPLGRYCHVEMGQSPPSADYNRSSDGLPFFQGKADFGATHPTPRYWCTRPTKLARPGDVLLSVRAPVGPTNVADVDCCIGRGLAALRPLASAPTRFLLWAVRAFAADLEALGTGTTFSAISRASIDPFLVPIPPLAEQHRIVARVDELMGLLDRLHAAQMTRDATRVAVRDSALDGLRKADAPGEVDVAWNRFAVRSDQLLCDATDVTPLRETVLYLAVRGKLVPQDPNDEPASVLLARIAAEKTRLMKAGGIRRPQLLLSLSDGDLPFLVPRGWTWVRIGELTSSLDYGSSAKSRETGMIPVLRMGNLQRGKIDWSDLKFSDDASEIETYSLAPNTVLFNRTNSPALVGKTALYRGERPAIFAGYLIRVALLPGVSPQYVNIWMNSPLARDWCQRSRQDGVSQSNISAGKLASLYIPLPPLAEQHRIVARIDELLGLLDRLEERLVAARTAHVAFAAAAVHHLDA